jgi:large subunit ribosomal protein L21
MDIGSAVRSRQGAGRGQRRRGWRKSFILRRFDSFFAFGYNARLSRSGGSSGQEVETMYAVIKAGGKQYRVASGEKLRIEQVAAEVGSEIVLDQVLMVADGENVTLGTPTLSGASVKAKVIAQGRGDKVHIFKMRRRKHYRKSQGHRQNYTEIEILGIAA